MSLTTEQVKWKIFAGKKKDYLIELPYTLRLLLTWGCLGGVVFVLVSTLQNIL